MQTAKKLFVSSIVLMLLVGIALIALAQTASAQATPSQTTIAREKRVKLSRGQSKKIVGKTDATTNYVYKIRAQRDQSLEARITSEGGAATFSIIPPGTQILENAAAVSQWSGTLPETGEYSIVVVMNTKGATKMPYTLELALK